MKKIIIMLMMVIMMTSVYADTRIIDSHLDVSGVAEPSATKFTFINGASANPIVGTYYSGNALGYIYPGALGQKCSVGQYIVVLQCSTESGSNCIRVFNDDYQKESISDLVPYSNWKDVQWMKDLVKDRPFTFYRCLAEYKTQEVSTKKEVSGKFTQVSVPSEGKVNGKITITGSFFVTNEGPMVLEAHINPSSQRPLSILKTDVGACGANAYYAGYKLYGEAGKTYNFEYTVKAPSQEGEYDVEVYVYTACSRDGGTQVQLITRPIKIKGDFFSSSKCGTKDSDSDGVFDGCDLCPDIFGSKDNWGCHPCYRMDPTTDSGKSCYIANEKYYAIPDEVKPLMDAVVSTIQKCEGNKVVTYKVHESGKQVIFKTDSCGTNQECIIGISNNAMCQDISKELKIVDYKLECYEGNVAQYNVMSDNSKVLGIDVYRNCFGAGCKDAVCLTEEVEEVSGPIYVEGSTCTLSIECNSNEYCDPLGQCVPYQDTECQIDSDCEAGKYCSESLQICLKEQDIQCLLDMDCKENEYCYDGWCLPDIEYINGTTPNICTADEYMTCDNGDRIITGYCKEGELYPLTNYCGGDPVSATPSVSQSNFLESEFEFINDDLSDWDSNAWFKTIGIIIILGILVYVIVNKKPKKQGRKK